MAKEKDTKKRKSVDLYDPKFVYFDWNENLQDKEGFYGDSIAWIKRQVESNELNYKYKGVCHSNDLNSPFKIGNYDWTFFYYDPNYEVKWAYFKEGKTVQYYKDSYDEWHDILPDHTPHYFDDDYEYRIKPEEESKKEPKLDVNVDVNIKSTSEVGSIKIQINGKEVIFKNTEEARLVLGIKEE